MNRQTFQILRMLASPRVTRTPLKVMRQLRREGRPRLPESVQKEVARHRPPGLNTFQFVQRWLNGELLSRHRGQWVLNSFLPPFPGPAYERMFTNLLSGRRLSPVSAYCAVTAKCPYQCWHCSLHGRRQGHLTTEQWLAAIEQLHGIGASVIGFTGGEPLCREDLPELVRAATAGGAEAIVFTSGALLDEKRAERLREAGLWGLAVSLDHPSESRFDRMRGRPGAFQQALRALKIARDSGFYTMLSTVATRPVVEQCLYLQLYEIAAEVGAHEHRLIEPMPCGKLAGADQATLLTPEHIREIRAFHIETNRRGKLPKVCAFNQIESPEVFGCGAGTQHLFIDSAGEVCPCDFTPLSFGNVTGEPLPRVWQRMNTAMGAPRRHCFIQCHRGKINKHPEQGFPLPPEVSEKICAEAGREPLPDYFALIMGATTAKKNAA